MEENAGDVITMSACCKHTVIAETELQMIEVLQSQICEENLRPEARACRRARWEGRSAWRIRRNMRWGDWEVGMRVGHVNFF